MKHNNQYYETVRLTVVAVSTGANDYAAALKGERRLGYK